jgi:hypothetical protein
MASWRTFSAFSAVRAWRAAAVSALSGQTFAGPADLGQTLLGIAALLGFATPA